MVEYTGGCACRAVRFKIRAEPAGVRYCMCRGCQYLGAGSGTVGAAFPLSAVTMTGETSDFANTADSGTQMHRRFCSACGTPLFSQAESRPGTIIIRVGAMDDPDAFVPTSIIWTKSAPKWICLDESLTMVEGQPVSPAPSNP